MLLLVRSLSKRYRKFQALTDLSFTVSSGEIVGLLGPNGAGKTTSLRCIAGIVRPTTGSILVDGCDLLGGGEAEREAKRRIAFVPEQPNPYELLTVWEHLKFIALAYGTTDGFDTRAAQLLVRFDLAAKRDALVGTLSKGMRQKLTIACAFVRHATVFLFDEPLIGLDPRGARELREQLIAARDAGAAILISTHMLDTAQTLCDRIVILRQGTMVAEGTLDALRDRAQATGAASLEEVFFTLTGEPADTNTAVIPSAGAG
ncbi:MAG: ABC transporter ATP-binding protein [Cytophagales bacterium]|nr:ABC transporter ATP-binding protein [Armatimonadota bacterium]